MMKKVLVSIFLAASLTTLGVGVGAGLFFLHKEIKTPTKKAMFASVRMPSADSITYDFSGATRKGSPGLYKYFTTNTADDARITRNVADFNRDSLGGKGWKGMINFHGVYRLDSIKFYDRSGSVDTFWIYTFKDAPNWDTIINTEDYTPDYLVRTCGTCSGLPVTTKINALANDTVRFALVVFRRTNLFSGLWPDVSNISFYGEYINQGDTTYDLAQWTWQSWTPRTIGEIVNGFNLQNQQDTLWSDTALVDYNYVRTFDQMFFDDQNVAMGSQSINGGGGGYTAFAYQKQLASKGHYQFSAVFNDNAYFKAGQVAAGRSLQKQWGTNQWGDDPQLPASYSRKGYYMHALAKAGGTCTGCPDVRWYNTAPTLNQGYLKILGTSNEPTLFAFPAAWKTPIEVAAESLGVYDSVKVGDPNILVFVAGYEAYNYDDAKATIMLQKLYLRSRTLKMDGIDFHAIHTLKTDSFSVIPTTNQQIGNYGVSPGYWDDWRKNINYINGVRREAGSTTLLVSLTEDTYQKGIYKRYPIDAGETFSVSQLACPTFVVESATLNRYESHAVAGLQLDAIVSASGLYQHYWYTAVDDIVSTNNPGYDAIDGNNGLHDRPATCCTEVPEAWPIAFAKASRKRRMGNFYFTDTVSYTIGGLVVFKYEHISNADSLAFEYFINDSTGTGTASLTGLNATSGKIIKPSFSTRVATESTASISSGAISLSADPLPRFFIVYSPAAAILGGGFTTRMPKVKR